MKTPRIAHEWQEYIRLVIHPDAPPDQLWETRRAFYAGAFSMLTIVQGLGDDSVSEDRGIEILEELRGEIDQFYEGVKRGVR